MRLIAGNPLRCSARVIGPRKQPTEVIGPVAGDSVTAAFEFASGVMGYFASQKHSGPASQRYGVTIFGSKGAMDFPLTTVPNTAWLLRSPSWRGEWVKIETPGAKPIRSQAELNPLMARDLIAAIEENRKPACSAEDGLWTIEMVQAVYASSIAGRTLTLPLDKRRHPLL
jgi:predicted dehydrogenase